MWYNNDSKEKVDFFLPCPTKHGHYDPTLPLREAGHLRQRIADLPTVTALWADYGYGRREREPVGPPPTLHICGFYFLVRRQGGKLLLKAQAFKSLPFGEVLFWKYQQFKRSGLGHLYKVLAGFVTF